MGIWTRPHWVTGRCGMIGSFHDQSTHPPLKGYTYAEQRPLMKLSRDEELFLRHWMYDEVHYEEGPGPPSGYRSNIGPSPATWPS